MNSTQSDLASSNPCLSSTFLEGLGDEVRTDVRTDSQVAHATALSQGLREMNHVELKFLVVQEVTSPERDHDTRKASTILLTCSASGRFSA